MVFTSSQSPAVPDLDLEPTPPEVKRYQRQKLTAALLSMLMSLIFLVVIALLAGPKLNEIIQAWVGENRWVRLVALAFVYAAAMELLTLPLDYWSGFVLEHRYHLSNLTFPKWVWRRLKGYLVGGPI